MKNLIIFSILIIALIFFGYAFENLMIFKKIEFIRTNAKNLIQLENLEPIIFLGKMGYGYSGAENTDSIFILYPHYQNKKIFIIHIPRDLLINLDGDSYKINSLYAFGKLNKILDEASQISGLKIKKYVIFDSYLLKEVVDSLGGLEVDLKYPVVDAVSGYTLLPGKRKLNGEWVEFVVRSRYYPQGDFTRMENQFIIIKSLKNKLINLSVNDFINLVSLVTKSQKHLQTNLSYSEIFYLYNKLKNYDIDDILLDLNTNLWVSGEFKIKIDNQNYVYSFGLIPKDGIGEYKAIRDKIKEKITQKP
jgi:LCP family protein required for cell wall assembly